MTCNDLIERLKKFPEDAIVILGDTESGWSNIDSLKSDDITVSIIGEQYPVFSDN